jgi:hypothetical protein
VAGAVVIDHDDVDPEALCQTHRRPRVDAVIDRDKQVCSAARKTMNCG